MIMYLCCVDCKNVLKVNNGHLICVKCGRKYKVNGRTVKMMPNLSPEMKRMIKTWDELYASELKSKEYIENYAVFVNRYFDKIYRQLAEVRKKSKDVVYLEIGSGYFFIGQNMAKDCNLVIGVEICPSAIKIAKRMLEARKITNYLLIEGDILHMPIKNNMIDLVYGGGVIEHFEDTQPVVNEYFRVLKKGGISFNTVPYLNLGSLTYRQLWGNIPNIPILRQSFLFFHTKILRAKHMRYGYEMSFLAYTLKSLHKKAGFRKVKVEKFDIFIYFEFLPTKIRKPFIWLATNSRLFWPMVKVIAVK